MKGSEHCRSARLLLLAAVASTPLAAAPQAPLPLHPYSYHESFEGRLPPIRLWASNGKAEVRFLGPSDEHVADGARSLKMEVVLKSGTYWYWGTPVSVPCAGRLRISAKLWVDPTSTARVGFGVNRLYPPTRHSGCGAFRTASNAADRGKWLTIQDDLVASGEQGKRSVLSRWTAGFPPDAAGCILDRWSIFVYGKPGDRATFWLDDIRIEGEVPDKKAYLDSFRERFQKATAAFRRRVAGWQTELATALREFETATRDLPPVLETSARSVRARAARATRMLKEFAQQGYTRPEKLAAFRQCLNMLRYGPEALNLARQTLKKGTPVVCIANNRPVDDTRAAPEGFPLAHKPAGALKCSPCPGEFEPVSLIIFAARDLRGFRVIPRALEGPDGAVLPAAALDVRIIKWWYQGKGRTIHASSEKELKAELLLYDDALVRVDRTKEANYLRSTGPDGKQRYVLCSGTDSANLADVRPKDAATLQPVDIPRGVVREFWITVHVPDGVPPGLYRGRLEWRADGGASGTVPIEVRVHPFKLAPPRLIYAIYYTGRLSPDDRPAIGCTRKSRQQYRVEMQNLRNHGVLYPTSYQRWNPEILFRIFAIRREAGLPTDMFFNLGRTTGCPQTPEKLAALARDVRKWVAFCRKHGYRDVYFYGIDEASGERLRAQRAAWKTVQEAGGKTFVACYLKTFEDMGGLLNCAVLAGPPRREEARKWHSVGSLIFCYANPQVGVEDPEVYRRNFGLLLWKNGYDGAMDFAYQYAFHHIWNDFDDTRYRDHNFTYPTVDGVVDTIQWEGFREGVDDVRYVTTLEQTIRKARAAHPALAESAQQWLNSIDPAAADLYALRAKIVDWILRLRAAIH